MLAPNLKEKYVMKRVFIVFLGLIFVLFGLVPIAASKNYNGKNLSSPQNRESRDLLKGEIFGQGNFGCIIPVNKTALQLLTTNSLNSFAFVLFYSEEGLKRNFSPTSIEKNCIVLNQPRFPSGRASVKLSDIKGFDVYFKTLSNFSRYDIADKMNEITLNISNAHRLYSSEYNKYINLIFEVSDSSDYNFENNYDLANQKLELDIIGQTLVKLFDNTSNADRYNTRDSDKLFTMFTRTNNSGRLISKEIDVQLPAKIAKDIAENTRNKSSKIEYKYIIEPRAGVERESCSIVGICGWMPSFTIQKIVITLTNNDGHNLVSYQIENITKNTVSYTPSFDNQKRQAAIVKYESWGGRVK